MKNAIVEVSVKSVEGERIPVGLMNTQQALSLPDELEFEVSHPEHEAGRTEVLLDRAELQDHLNTTA